MKKYLFFALTSLLFIGCTSKNWVITSAKTTKISIDSSLNSIADKDMTAFITPIKQNLDKEMNQVIGYSTSVMKAGKPESLLSNWASDVYVEAGSAFLKQPVDFAVVNLGGLRSYLPKGDLTVRNIFELMPFENELVLLWIKGDDAEKLFQIFALEGGQGISGVRFEIKDSKAYNITINGKLIDKNAVYVVATNDYLAGGNDRMTPLTNAIKKMDTGLKIRNIFMEKVVRETQKGNKIHSELDGRITINQ